VLPSNELAVTTALAVTWENHHLVLNAHRAGDSTVAVPFGGRVPIDGSSWGKVYYAWSGASVPEKLESYTPASVTDRAKYEREIQEVRARGYATDREEFSSGVGGVAAPITSSVGYEGLAFVPSPDVTGRHDRHREVGPAPFGVGGACLPRAW